MEDDFKNNNNNGRSNDFTKDVKKESIFKF